MSAGSRDRLVFEGLTFYGYHGDHSAERELGQRFVVDLALTLDLRPAGETDDLAKTVDYVDLVAVLRGIVEGEPCRLIETVAERIAAAVLARYPVELVRVRVNKPAAAIPGAVYSRLAVEITRRREVYDRDGA